MDTATYFLVDVAREAFDALIHILVAVSGRILSSCPTFFTMRSTISAPGGVVAEGVSAQGRSPRSIRAEKIFCADSLLQEQDSVASSSVCFRSLGVSFLLTLDAGTLENAPCPAMSVGSAPVASAIQCTRSAGGMRRPDESVGMPRIAGWESRARAEARFAGFVCKQERMRLRRGEFGLMSGVVLEEEEEEEAVVAEAVVEER